MALTIVDTRNQLNEFFDTVENNVLNSVADVELPLLGKLSDLPGGGAAADPFGALKTQVLNAVGAAAGVDVAQAIADAVRGLGIAGLSAVKTAADGVDIMFTTEKRVSTGTAELDIGKSVGDFLVFKANTGASLTAALNATLSFSADGEFSLKDQLAPQLTVSVGADLSVVNANANLGVADVTLNDADLAKPEFQAEFGFDLGLAADGTFTVAPTLTASAGLNLSFSTTDVLAGLLPDMRGKLLIDFTVLGTSFNAPTISVTDLKVDLGSYLGIVGDVFGDFGKLFNSGPLGTIVDVATEPVPVLNDLAHTFGLVNRFDKVGGLTGGGDGVITIGDLAAYQSQAAADILDPWYRTINIVSQIRKIGALADVGEIDFGGGTLVGGTTVPDNDPASIVAALKDRLNDLGLSAEVTDFLSDIEIGGLASAAAGATPSKGFTFSLFEHPGDVLKILLTNQPVNLIEFDVPPLKFDEAAGGFFPVLGPLGFILEGRLKAGIDVDIGYDTQGLINKQFQDGFYVKTADDPDPSNNKLDNPEQLGFLPVGNLNTQLTGGAGAGFAGSSLTVNAGFGFELSAYFAAASPEPPATFADGKFRPGADDYSCIFDPVGGRATVSVNVTIKIGFGPFSIKKNIPLAEATLADFDVFKCPPPSVQATLLAPGLATVVGEDLLLNVGEPDRADQRKIVDEHDGVAKLVATYDDPATVAINESLNEAYVIGLARNQSGNNINPADNPAPVLVVPAQLDVFAFGFTQRVDIPVIIRADFKGGADMLVIQRDVIVDSEVSGGDGNDVLTGGGGRDILRGDANDDVLAGNDGNDDLAGGTGDDQLSGGRGADRMDGGDGIDTIDYSRANQDTRQGVYVTITKVGDVIGRGGEAEGDLLISIESLIGTDFADHFRAGFGVTQKLVFDGGKGNDILIGGMGEDLLLGGEGADLLNGDVAIRESDGFPGYDGTSYVTSWGAVDIDLQRTIQRGGDAQGDRLFSIEAVEGSINSDMLLGDASANILFGNDGNDVLEGRGGIDEVGGGFGNDLIYGGADGDTLDGGAGVDTLSYEHVGGPVTVDLGGSQLKFLGLTVFVPGAAPDNIVMERPLEGGARGRSTFENLVGSNAGDLLAGDIGDNLIKGLDGDDFINGDAGFDVLVGGFGADVLIGGSGIDWVYYSDSPTGVYVDLLGGGFFGTAQGDIFGAVENILGSTSADALFGDDVDNIIDPNISGAMVTEFVGGGGSFNDTLRLDYSSVQADIGQGVAGGFDYTHFDVGSFQRLTASGTATLDTIHFSNIERLDVVGTRSADTIIGGFGDDVIITGDGNDYVLAGNGADVVYTGRGDDFVAYNHLEGNDSVLGGNGTEVFKLSGGRGIDTLSISLEGATEDITLVGRTDAAEGGVNLRLANGAAVILFERLKDITTGTGNDVVEQLGNYDNVFSTHGAQDIIQPGLGVDSVDGGDDFTVGKEIDFGFAPPNSFGSIIKNGLLFAQNNGDLLILDYSAFTGANGVIGTVDERSVDSLYRVISGGNGDNAFIVTLTSSFSTNDGNYVGGSIGDPSYTRVDFTNIERLIVTGSEQGDYLEGTDDSYRFLSFNLPNGGDAALASNSRGDDFLSGGAGNDVLIGKSGSDFLFGDDGNDILIGSTPDDRSITGDDNLQTEGNDPNEIDYLSGGAGADTFVLGITTVKADNVVKSGYFYASYGRETLPLTNRAVITDFNAGEGDTILLSGNAGYYAFEVINSGTADVATLIYHKLPPGRAPQQLIAEVRGVSTFDFNADYVTYANAGNLGVGGAGGFPAAGAALGVLAAPSLFAPPADIQPPAAILEAIPAAALATSWVQQNGNVAELKAVFDGAAGGAGSTLTLSGSAEAFGTFDGDPFGLGKGIILSTGNVEDLPGPNTSQSAGSNVTSIPITFVKIGTTGLVDIFKADLSNLGIDLRSITLKDSNNELGGSGGIASGFDLDGLLLSRSNLAAANSVADLNSLTKLDVFDFSAASLTFQPGFQSPPTNATFPYGTDLKGSINGLVDQAAVRLDIFNENFSQGYLTLGRGGSLGFDLTSTVSTNQPLYLYAAEVGANGENLVGSINVSSDTIEPTGDLSTDLGAAGSEGDTTSLTYTFTPKTGDTAFSLDVVLFSEELPEFDGTDLTDLYSIKLNGVEISALSNGAALTIKNLVYAASGDLIFNPVGTGPLADSIKADAYTKTLTISGAIDPGVANTLTIEVKDGRDAFLDSGLLIKDGSFKTFPLPVLPALRIMAANADRPEGDLVPTTFTFTVTRVGDTSVATIVDYTISGIGPHAADSNDFGGIFPSGSLSFAPGETLQTLTIEVNGDMMVEPDEAFAVTLANPQNGILEVAMASGTIQNDDVPPPPELSIAALDAVKAEGDSGTTAFTFKVTRTGDLSGETSVHFGVSGAVDGFDFAGGVLPSGTLVFTPGSGEQLLTLQVAGDTRVEPHEAFTLTLTEPVNGNLATAAAQGIIQNDDHFSIHIGDAPVRPLKSDAGAWERSWSDSHVDISHKANLTDANEAYSDVLFVSSGSAVLNGGDISGGDLGVSGQTLATSAVKQEIDGTESLRFSLDQEATGISFNLSRFFANDDNTGLTEAGRVQFLNLAHEIVKDVQFFADSANGNKQMTIDVSGGFVEALFSAGASNDTDFVFGAYGNAAGNGYGGASNAGHGSDYLVDAVTFEIGAVAVIGSILPNNPTDLFIV